MKTTRLGKTGLEVSRVGFGGIPIQRLTEDEAVRVVKRCLELGVTFLDTANGYTTSEERIGLAIAAMEGQRGQLVIATKTTARDRATAQTHLELSLKRLNVDTIDLWQFHNLSRRQWGHGSFGRPRRLWPGPIPVHQRWLHSPQSALRRPHRRVPGSE